MSNASEGGDSGSATFCGNDVPLPTHGIASYEKKGEDCVAVTVGPDEAVYAVFDGHGGSSLSRACASHAWRRENLVERFWKLDEKLGPRRLSEGTTASVLVVDRPEGGGGSRVTCAWVGDSQIMEIDMLAPEANAAFFSEAHAAGNDREVARLQRQWETRDAFAASKPAGAEDDAAFHARALAAAGPVALDAEDRDLLARSMEYERRVDAALAAAAPPHLTRCRSLVAQRLNEWTGQRAGPLVVEATWRDEAAGRVVVGASTSVTRSVGDWDSSRGLVPEPGTRTTLVRDGEFRRYVVASDGLWAYASSKAVAKLAHDRDHAYDPQECAHLLLELVRRATARRCASTSHAFLDDTTILVVDVLPAPDATERLKPNFARKSPFKASRKSLDALLGSFSRSMSFGKLSRSNSAASLDSAGSRDKPRSAGDAPGSASTPTSKTGSSAPTRFWGRKKSASHDH